MAMDKRSRCIQIIPAALGAGAPDSRCAEGPLRLIESGLAVRLKNRGICTFAAEPIHERPGPTRAGTVLEFCSRLAASVERVAASGELPVVLGGDHSCAIGTWSGAAHALAARGSLGLVWIDAHMDSHTLDTTPSGMIHGMPLAVLLGERGGAFAPWTGATLSPRHVCLVGVRSFEPDEAQLLSNLGVRIFTMADIAERGLDRVMDSAVAIATQGTAGFGISIDLDALDPREAPGVGSPEPEGLFTAGLMQALSRHGSDPRLAAIELTEYNPYLDAEGRTARVVEDLLGAALAQPPSLIELEARYGAPNYEPLPAVLVRGKGTQVWDTNGRHYLDMMSAYSAVSFGHTHPRLVAALMRQAGTLAVTSRAFYNDRLPGLLEALCRLTGQDRALPVNTGLEAVETAIKAARKWAYEVKGVSPGQAEIIACEGNFHGRSLAIVAMSSEAEYRRGFGPFPPGFRIIPYGDARALEAAIGATTAAFLVEPIQGERGIVVPPPGYLARCASICRERNVLFIADEVQTGLGRTGRLLACDHEGVKPDGLVLGKALGGGLLPVSAFLARSDVLMVLGPGTHGSTFGGNPLACAVALEALAVLTEERLAERAAELGPYLMCELAAIPVSFVREVRGRGLLVGVQIDTGRINARSLAERLLRHGILTKDTHGDVIRVAPPLVITKAEIDEALARIRRAFLEAEASLGSAGHLAREPV